MGKILKSFLIIIITLVVLVALAIGGVWGFFYFKYKVNVFSVIGTLNSLQNIDTTKIIDNQVTDSDYSSAQSTVNGSIAGLITYDSTTETYSIGDPSTPMTQAINLTDKQLCALLNIIIQNEEAQIHVGEQTIKLEDYGFKLWQIKFSNYVAATVETPMTVDINFVASIELQKIKDQMNSFPLSLVKNKVPKTLYVTSTAKLTKQEGVFSYTTESVNFMLNNVEEKDLNPVFTLLNAFGNFGTVADLNNQISQTFINYIIGDSEHTTAFSYKLKEDAGATDFNFGTQSETIVYQILM